MVESSISSLSPEAQTTKTLADIRRQSAELKRALSKLAPAGSPALEAIRREADGSAVISKDQAERELGREEELRMLAETFAAAAPRYAAYLRAYLAKLEQLSGRGFTPDLEAAKKYLSRASGAAPTKPDDLFAHALVLGIARRMATGKGVSGAAELARIMGEDERLLPDIALVLKEDDRSTFLSSLPAQKQVRYSAHMDKEASTVLGKEILEADSDKRQAKEVGVRAGKAIKDMLRAPQKDMIPVVKLLAQTLAELGSEESTRLLAELGADGLEGAKDPVKEVQETKERAKVSKVARIVKTLADIDANKGGMLAMKFLAKSAIPPRLFVFFCAKLMQSGYLTPKLMPYLGDKKALPFVRELIQKYPSQFNTVIDTLSQIKNYDPSQNPQEVFSALDDLDTLTPLIFDEYRTAPDKKEFTRQIKEVLRNFFRNVPIDNILPANKRRVLAEMVYLAYKPVNMSFEKVQALMRNLGDRTDDIRDYTFPEDGYDFSLSANRTVALKKGESLDLTKLRAYKSIFAEPHLEEKDAATRLEDILTSFAKGAALDAKKENEYKEGLGIVISIMRGDQRIKNFLGAYPTVTHDNAYDYLAELEELWNIYLA